MQTQTDLAEKREETFYSVFAVWLTIRYKLIQIKNKIVKASIS